MKTNKQFILAGIFLYFIHVPNGLSQSLVRSGNLGTQKISASGGHGGGNGGDGLELSSPLRLGSRIGETLSEVTCEVSNSNSKAFFALLRAPDGDPSKVESFLKEHIIAVDSVNESCENALQYTLKEKKFEIFDFLYGYYRSPSINSRNYKSLKSTFDYILEFGNLKLIKRFYGIGEKSPVYKLKLYQLFKTRKNLEIDVLKAVLELHLEDINAEIQEGFGNSILFYAAQISSSETIEALVSSGALVNTRDRFGNSALFSAARAANFSAVKTLIQLKSDLRNKNKAGDGVFLYASISGDVSLLDYLVKAGVDTQTTNRLGTSPLIVAAYSNPDVDVIKFLIPISEVNAVDNINGVLEDLKKDIDLKHLLENELGNTALMRAVEHNPNEKVIRVLVQSGSEIYRKNNKGLTAFDIALKTGRSNEILDLLK